MENVAVKENEEICKFDAEIGKVLHLMIHSLYTDKDIFLRELISNAADACDKLRYLSLTDQALLENNSDFQITISSDKDANLLTISDNGIGMNRAELIENLGTIAKSGTQNFLKNLTGDSKKDVELIGQFGVGFYSSFMVADEVTVKSRKAGEAGGHIWSSKGEGEFTIKAADEELPRGTQITLKLKEDAKDYLDKFTLEHIITTYSDFVNIPIAFKDGDKLDVLNSAQALWTKPKKDITEQQYLEFYRGVAHMGDNPWLTLHNKNEGMVSYTNLLFIPSRKPFNLFHPDRQGDVKLYVKKIFITENAVEIIPPYLRFVKGIVDSEDLPLNISRQTLQDSQIIEKIRKSLVKKIITELRKVAEDDAVKYAEFWENFGAVLKEGLCESFESREDILEICRFRSLLNDDYISIKRYVENMKPDQTNIFFLTGEAYDKLKNSPQVQAFKQRGIDVLLLTDSVDEFWTSVVHQYKEHEFKSITRAGIDLDKIAPSADDASEPEQINETANKKLEEYCKSVLGELVKEVMVSSKLVDSPACLSVSDGSMDIRMEKFMMEQKQLAKASAKILEINPKNKIVANITDAVQSNATNEQTADLVHMLYDQACVMEGLPLADINAYARRVNALIEASL